ncbi:hypothetical protein [Cytobacillus pseudoceanisediminis]|uniref:hypothetical protein n=1 Tax=Cytobacillus pseudoceanisediminis TaxID=3051614 RepID=UPI003CE6C746
MKRKLTESQKRRLHELKERNKTIDNLIIEKIDDHVQPLPLNLILEARFNSVMKKAIYLEGEIAYLKEEDGQFVEGQIEVKKRRLDIMRGQLHELQNVGEMLNKYDLLGREFEIVRR